MSTLSVFDIDDTIFRTKAKALIVKDGVIVRKLDSKELQNYKLQDGEQLDWSEFRSAEFFYETSTPIIQTIHIAQQLIQQKKREPNDKIILITARPNLDDKEKFLSTFRKYGLDTDSMYIERVGNQGTGYGSIVAGRKVRAIKQHLTSGNFNLVQMFEDSRINLNAFIRFSYSYPHIAFHAYLVNPAGKVIPFK